MQTILQQTLVTIDASGDPVAVEIQAGKGTVTFPLKDRMNLDDKLRFYEGIKRGSLEDEKIKNIEISGKGGTYAL